MQVAMDTNALMMPVEVGVRVFEELERVELRSTDGPRGDEPRSYDPIVPAAVITELENLAQTSGEEGTAASVGLDLAERCKTVETDVSYADDALCELAETGDADAVVTNDGPLKERLLDAGVPVIHLRGRNQLTTTQP